MSTVDDGDSDFDFHDDLANSSFHDWLEDSESSYFFYWQPSTILYFIVLTIGFAIGVVGNCFILFIIPKFSCLRTLPNYILWNLALVDLIFLAVIPLDLVTLLAENWVFNLFLCQLFLTVPLLKAMGSSLLLIALGIERYTAFHCPDLQIVRRPLSWILIVHAIWILSIVFGLPVLLTAERLELNTDANVFCHSNWSSAVYTLLLFIITLIPVGICCTLLLRVMSRLREDPVTRGRIFPEKIYLILAMIASHLICWIIYYAINIPVAVFATYTEYDSWTSILFTLSECLLEMNSAVNPILMLILCTDLKRSAAKLFGFTANFGDEIEHVPLA